MIRMSLLSRFLITVTSIMAPSITAMDNTNTPKILQADDSSKSICHLLQLPDEIKRYIAFLAFEWELEKEFVERTRIQEQVPCMYYENLLTSKEASYNAVYCPHKINIALLELLPGDSRQATITIIDSANNTLVHSEKLNQLTSHAAVAVSQHAALFATIRRTTLGYRELTSKNNVAVLEVKNISTQKIQEFDIHALFPRINLISFNKQGTQIIVHTVVEATCIKGKITESNPVPSRFTKINPTSPYKVFDLKTEVQDGITSVRPLEYYLRQQLICTGLMKSL